MFFLEATAKRIIDNAPYAFLSLVDTEQNPYCVPITPVRHTTSIYFHTALKGQKVACLRHNPHVCLSFVSEAAVIQAHFTMEYAAALVRGTATEILEPEEKLFALRLLCERYTPDNMAAFAKTAQKSLAVTGIWSIKIEELSCRYKKYTADERVIIIK